jgi:hypothetical protein
MLGDICVNILSLKIQQENITGRNCKFLFLNVNKFSSCCNVIVPLYEKFLYFIYSFQELLKGENNDLKFMMKMLMSWSDLDQ